MQFVDASECDNANTSVASAVGGCAVPKPSSSATVVCPKAANSGNKTELSETAFRLAEKRYKLFRLDARASKRTQVEESDFSDVIDFHNLEDGNSAENKAMMRLVSEIDVPLHKQKAAQKDDSETTLMSIAEAAGIAPDSETDVKRHRAEAGSSSQLQLDDASEASTAAAATRKQRCYTFDGVPGLLFFPQALTNEEQQYWCTQALDRYAQSPPFPNNLTTLDANIATTRYGGPHTKKAAMEAKKEEQTEKKESTRATDTFVVPAASTNKGSAAAAAAAVTTGKPSKSQQQPHSTPKERMRWATLGFKYNWTTKSYTPSEYCLFPGDLSKMIRDTFFTMLAPVAASALGDGGDAEAVAKATAKAVDLAKGLQMPCKYAAAAAASSSRSGGAAAADADEMVSVGGMLVKRSELSTAAADAGAPTCTSSSSPTSVPTAAAAPAVDGSVTSNPNGLRAAAPITLLANAVAASHKAISNEEILSALLSPSYEPQTAIVNYFPVGTMMCAHQDLSEPCLHRPLISVSIGASCIFLMGTTSREDKPHAFLLRSGDIIAFTGPARVAFHAVPRVLEDCPQHLVDHDARMKGLRININVRQVYDEAQPQLADPLLAGMQ